MEKTKKKTIEQSIPNLYHGFKLLFHGNFITKTKKNENGILYRYAVASRISTSRHSIYHFSSNPEFLPVLKLCENNGSFKVNFIVVSRRESSHDIYFM